MIHALKSMWVLYFGAAVLWLGTGMSFSLLIVRADAEGFSAFQIGLMQTSYQIGWIVAAIVAPRMILNVGHVRVFGAMAAASSAVIITHLIYINPWVWSAERFLMGICTATLMVVSESWLNDMSDNRNRGQVLALYTILSWGAPVVGVWLLRYNSTETAFFFIVASICISVAVIPMLLSASRTPSFIEAERIGLKQLYKITPLGVIGALLAGACHGAFFATVSIFGTISDYTVEQISTLTAIALAGGIVTQWPIAMISDRLDRRKVLAATALGGGTVAMYFSSVPNSSINDVYIATGCVSALILSLYSLCISHANDYLTPQQIVPASSTLILIYGTGYAATPTIIAPMLTLSPDLFFTSNGALMLTLGLYVLYRMMRRESVALEEQGDTVSLATASPYAAVVTAAEEWGEDVHTEQADNDEIEETY